MSEMGELIRILTLDDFDERAAEPARECVREGNDYAREAGISVHRFMASHWNSLQYSEGLIDVWIGTLIFITFAQGIAAGDGRKQVTEGDISQAKEKLCMRFPACYAMRLKAAIEALELLSRHEPKSTEEYIGLLLADSRLADEESSA